ncbi:MAG: IPT/TIG domain-containing protein, partial [Psychrosphaera sp.]|nr:IPT/TIG domain-containing protein [Psychrosphaera sp.]
LIEIIDLDQINDSNVDFTVPVVTHPNMTNGGGYKEMGPRGMIVARGAIQVAGGRQGIQSIELPSLTVMQHWPTRDQFEVSSQPDKLSIELSSVLRPDTVLANWLRVMVADPLIGEDISDYFDIRFTQRNGEPAYRFIELVLKADRTLDAATPYYVTVKQGLSPLTGVALAADYTFRFTTSVAGAQAPPEFASITPDIGDIDGGTAVVIRGHHFLTGNSGVNSGVNSGEAPIVELGGQRLRVESIEPATADDPFEKIFTTTVANYAGPAAVKITAQSGAYSIALGVYTYIDQLRLSFVKPGIVNVSQAGANDLVEIVGYGFHDGIRLKATVSDNPEMVVFDTVDQDRLRLYSSERMTWSVADFSSGNGGNDFRGFIDLQISDDRGRKSILPRALFYGQLNLNRTLETSAPVYGDTIADPLKLPPGAIIDLASDANLGLIYVLGEGLKGMKPSDVLDWQTVIDKFSPGWISLVHYNRDAIENAAPMHGLGYFNLPQDLQPKSLWLGKERLYVGALGHHFANINTPNEDLSLLLVYDREDRLPGSGGDAKDRDILFQLPLPFSSAPSYITGVDDILVVGTANEGLVVLNVANPLKPAVIRRITDASNKGQNTKLNITGLEIVDGRLHVFNRVSGTVAIRFIFDLNLPAIPQIAALADNRLSTALDKQTVFVGSDIALRDFAKPLFPRELGHYNGRGFGVPGASLSLDTTSTIVALQQLDQNVEKGVCDRYIPFYDVTRPELISLIDVLRLNCLNPQLSKEEVSIGDPHYQMHMSDDGLAVISSNHGRSGTEEKPPYTYSELSLIDYLTLDLVSSTPSHLTEDAPQDTPIKLVFNRAITVPAGQTEAAFLATYLALLHDDGSVEGQNVSINAKIDPQNNQVIIVEPVTQLQPNSLLPDSAYVIRLSHQRDSRRTQGLVELDIRFNTANGIGERLSIGAITPNVVDIGGGIIEVDVNNVNSGSPLFIIGNKAAAVTGSNVINGQKTRYTVAAPANFAGPATLKVIDSRQFTAFKIGAIQYVEPLVVSSLSPVSGNVNGGTKVQISGRGFRPGLTDISVTFDDIPVPSQSIKVLDTQTLEVITPPGRLGTVDVVVSMSTGQQDLLPQAYEYLQPSQSTMQTNGRIYDATLDPSSTYLFAAAGAKGVAVYDINASRYIADENDPLNPDDLIKLIDKNDDGIDDRILVEVPLPDGYVALGVKGYFERFNDRVFVTASNGSSSKLFILSFDSADITQVTVVTSLELPGDLARGLVVENQRALVAMGSGGLGVVDSYLHTKSYLVEQLVLPGNAPELDVAAIDRPIGQASVYAVAAGQFDLANNKLIDESDDAFDESLGGVYLIERSTTDGLKVISHIALPASRVVANGNTLYVAAGENGAAIIDVSDPYQPVVLHRIDDVGAVQDIDFNGNTLYLAQGEAGIHTVDVTAPASPVVLAGLDAASTSQIEVVVATNFAVIGGGYLSGSGELTKSIIQVFPDVILKLHSVTPGNGILDRNAQDQLKVSLRFNKAIDLWPQNLSLIDVSDAQGQTLEADISIVNNDVIIVLNDDHNLSVGDQLLITAKAGLASVKPLNPSAQDDRFIILYALAQTQQVALTYRGGRFDEISIVDVKPRRVPLDTASPITISALGVPTDLARVKVWVGDQALTISTIESNDLDQRAAIIYANLPKMPHAGQFDVKVEVLNDSVTESVIMYGAIVVDAPLAIDSLEPQWGPVDGGTQVTVYGQGFEPGNTLIDGIRLRIGSMPVASVKVLSSTKLILQTPSGRPGLHTLTADNRYGEQSVLIQGVGYGLKQLSTVNPDLVFPTDVYVDQQSGVALTSGGYFVDGHTNLPLLGTEFPDNLRAASFDIQDPVNPVLVGGAPALPSGPDGQAKLAADIARRALLEKKATALLSDNPNDGLNEEEQKLLEALGPMDPVLAFNQDSIRIQAVDEIDSDGVSRKRLYVASGNGGVSRLNLDEQNGLQFINNLYANQNHTTHMVKSGHSVFALNTVPKVVEIPDLREACTLSSFVDEQGVRSAVLAANFMDLNDPVALGTAGTPGSMKGSYSLHLNDGWLYSGGLYQNYDWKSGAEC